MIDITYKSNTLRKAIASATLVVSKAETMDAIQNNKVPKGNIFEFARAAGLLAIKKTSDVIPDCHPIPISELPERRRHRCSRSHRRRATMLPPAPAWDDSVGGTEPPNRSSAS